MNIDYIVIGILAGIVTICIGVVIYLCILYNIKNKRELVSWSRPKKNQNRNEDKHITNKALFIIMLMFGFFPFFDKTTFSDEKKIIDFFCECQRIFCFLNIMDTDNRGLIEDFKNIEFPLKMMKNDQDIHDISRLLPLFLNTYFSGQSTHLIVKYDPAIQSSLLSSTSSTSSTSPLPFLFVQVTSQNDFSSLISRKKEEDSYIPYAFIFQSNGPATFTSEVDVSSSSSSSKFQYQFVFRSFGDANPDPQSWNGFEFDSHTVQFHENVNKDDFLPNKDDKDIITNIWIILFVSPTFEQHKKLKNIKTLDKIIETISNTGGSVSKRNELNNWIQSYFWFEIEHQPCDLQITKTLDTWVYEQSQSITTNLNKYTWNVYKTVGDGTCSLHAFLNSICPSYRRLSEASKHRIGQVFRKVILLALFQPKSQLSTIPIDSDDWLYDDDIITVTDYFNVGLVFIDQLRRGNGSFYNMNLTFYEHSSKKDDYDILIFIYSNTVMKLQDKSSDKKVTGKISTIGGTHFESVGFSEKKNPSIIQFEMNLSGKDKKDVQQIVKGWKQAKINNEDSPWKFQQGDSIWCDQCSSTPDNDIDKKTFLILSSLKSENSYLVSEDNPTQPISILVDKPTKLGYDENKNVFVLDERLTNPNTGNQIITYKQYKDIKKISRDLLETSCNKILVKTG